MPTSACQTWVPPLGISMCAPNNGWVAASSDIADRSVTQNLLCCQGVAGTSTRRPLVSSGVVAPTVASWVWKNRVWSWSRFIVPVTIWSPAPSRVSVMAWVSTGCGLISMKARQPWCSAAAATLMAWWNRTGLRRLADQ
ncbi:hypothetical protein LAUMK7_02100 [Mycobacterium kansasii]|nr:hypothetical protein LAUMK40_02117 [Mycobacterium kansasii]VAZ73845.1 hypothetical protein LAUMK7_02100 [Mycobacterium kansasii]